MDSNRSPCDEHSSWRARIEGALADLRDNARHLLPPQDETKTSRDGEGSVDNDAI